MTFYSKEVSLLNYFYPLLFVVCYFQAMNIIPPGLPGEGIFIWPFRLFMVYMGFKAFCRNYKKFPIFNFYLLYSLGSLVFYIFNGYPVSLYFQNIAFLLTTMPFVYIGLDSSLDNSRFYKITLWAITGMFVVGLFLYFFPPSWYQAAWTRRMESKWYLEGMNYTYDQIAENMRFSSFMMTSYATQYFGIFALPFAITFMVRSSTKKEKLLYVLTLLIIIFCVTISLQRAAILGCTLVLFTYFFYDSFHLKKGSSMFIVSIIVVSFLVVLYGNSDLGIRVFERFQEINVDDVFNESRISQNENAFAAIQNIILGSGVGTGGAGARRLGFPAVSDSNYMLILFELGIVGSLVFIIMIVKTLGRVAKNFRYLFAEGSIVVCYLIAMIGSNALSFSLFSPLFWFALGRIWNNDYIRKLKLKDLKI